MWRYRGRAFKLTKCPTAKMVSRKWVDIPKFRWHRCLLLVLYVREKQRTPSSIHSLTLPVKSQRLETEGQVHIVQASRNLASSQVSDENRKKLEEIFFHDDIHKTRGQHLLLMGVTLYTNEAVASWNKCRQAELLQQCFILWCSAHREMTGQTSSAEQSTVYSKERIEQKIYLRILSVMDRQNRYVRIKHFPKNTSSKNTWI